MNYEPLTIAIPTNARPAALGACLRAINETVFGPHRILVANTTARSAPQEISAQYEDLRVKFGYEKVPAPENASPAYSRKILMDACETDCIQLLDDDMAPQKGAIETLRSHIAKRDIGVISGRCIEFGEERALGFSYREADINGSAGVLKHPFYYGDENYGEENDVVIAFDDVMPNILCRKSALHGVEFDPRYTFYCDLFDFFMQCRERGVGVAACPGAYFTHTPMRYQNETAKSWTDREVDLRAFQRKWSRVPLFCRVSNRPTGDRKRKQRRAAFAQKSGLSILSRVARLARWR